MASFLNSLTSRYLADEPSGTLLDSVGTHDFEDELGAPTHEGDSKSYDGVDDADRSSTISGNGVPITMGNDWTLYMHVTTLSSVGTVQERWIRPNPLAAFDGPFMGPLFGGGVGNWSVDIHASGGASGLTLSMGRDFNVDEECVASISYVHSTRELKAILKSKDGLDLSGTDSSGTSDPSFSGTSKYIIFENNGNFSHARLHEMGGVDGTAHSIADMQDTADELFDPNSPPTLVYNSVQQR